MHTKDQANYQPTCPLLASLVKAAKAAYPTADDMARIGRAAHLVETDCVSQEGSLWVVNSNCHRYMINGTCPCVDAAQRPDLTFCKHKFSVTLYKRWAAARQNSKQWYASLNVGSTQLHGVLTIWRHDDGTFSNFFQAHDSAESITLSDYQVVYELIPGGRVDLVEAARLERDAEIAALCGR